MIASEEGHVESVNYLLDIGSHVDLFDVDDKTALFIAAENNQYDVLQVLLEQNNDLIDTNDLYDNSPLHIACQKGKFKWVLSWSYLNALSRWTPSSLYFTKYLHRF